MNREQAIAFEDKMMGSAIMDIESAIKKLSAQAEAVSSTNRELQEDPRKALRKMKEKQLEKAMEAYGTVDLYAEDIERIPIIFARLQADEAAARRDLKTVKQLTDGESEVKKQLEIAKRVLAEKIKPGGRA